MNSTESYLKKHQLLASSFSIQKMVEDFIIEMQNGLGSDKS